MYFITRPWFCQHLFAIIFILFDRTRFSRVCTAFFTGFLPASIAALSACRLHSRAPFRHFCAGPLIWASCGRRFAPAGTAHFFRQKAVQSAKPAFFMIFLVSLLSFLCYNNLTICFNLCPCRGTGALRRASIGRRAAGFSLQRDTTEGRSYETGKRGNS